jgi:hypothetical protein
LKWDERRIISDGKGKYALFESGAKQGVRTNSIIIQILIDAPNHQLRQCTIGDALAVMGRSRRISVHIQTLVLNGIVESFDDGSVRLSAEALDKIKRGETIREGRNRILWEPDLVRSLRKEIGRKVCTDKMSGAEKVKAALQDGPRTLKELQKITRMPHSALPSLLSNMNGKQITRVDHGKYALPESDVEQWFPASQVIAQTVFDAGGEMKYSQLSKAMVAAGKSSHIASQLYTLRRNGVLANANGGPVRLSAEALDKIKRGETIRSKQGKVLWSPQLRSNA